MIDSDDEEASEVRLASSQGSQGIEAQFKKKERIRLIMDYYSISFEEVSVLLRSRSSSILFSSHNR